MAEPMLTLEWPHSSCHQGHKLGATGQLRVPCGGMDSNPLERPPGLSLQTRDSGTQCRSRHGLSHPPQVSRAQGVATASLGHASTPLLTNFGSTASVRELYDGLDALLPRCPVATLLCCHAVLLPRCSVGGLVYSADTSADTSGSAE